MVCKKEPIEREQVIAKYLSRSLDSEAVEEFEGHYLGCDECFDELRVSERLAADLRASNLAWKQTGGVSVLRFKANAELTHSARELDDLRREVLEQKRHAGHHRPEPGDPDRQRRPRPADELLFASGANRGALKVSTRRRRFSKLLDMTGLSTLIPTFHDEQEAVSSFNN